MLQEHGDRVQLLQLNADTQAGSKMHTHLHNHNPDGVSQVQSICIHRRFCIGSATYSVPSDCGMQLSTFTLGRAWTVSKCV